MGAASSLFAAGITYGIAERRWGVALVVAGAGLAAFLLTYMFTKRPTPSAPMPSIQVNPELNQQFNPQFNPTIQIGVPAPDHGAALAEQEKLQREERVLNFMRKVQEGSANQQRHITHLVESVASGTALNFNQAKETLDSLCLKGLLVRSTIEAEGDYVYWLRDAK